MHWRSIDRVRDERRRRRRRGDQQPVAAEAALRPILHMEVAAPPHKDLFVCPLAPVGRVQGSQRARGWLCELQSHREKEFLLASRPSEKSQRAASRSTHRSARDINNNKSIFWSVAAAPRSDWLYIYYYYTGLASSWSSNSRPYLRSQWGATVLLIMTPEENSGDRDCIRLRVCVKNCALRRRTTVLLAAPWEAKHLESQVANQSCFLVCLIWTMAQSY